MFCVRPLFVKDNFQWYVQTAESTSKEETWYQACSLSPINAFRTEYPELIKIDIDIDKTKYV